VVDGNSSVARARAARQTAALPRPLKEETQSLATLRLNRYGMAPRHTAARRRFTSVMMSPP
jgi:hypothetical protein